MVSSYKQKTFSVIASVLVSIFLISGIVVAATTIGSSLSTDGNLTVLGNAGIGTSTPASLFSVAGNGYFTGNVGVGTANPRTIMNWSGTVGPVLNIYGTGASDVARIAAQGMSGGSIELVNLGGTANARWLQLFYSGANLFFRRINDAGTSVVSAPFSLDVSNGNLTILTSVASPLFLGGKGAASSLALKSTSGVGTY